LEANNIVLGGQVFDEGGEVLAAGEAGVTTGVVGEGADVEGGNGGAETGGVGHAVVRVVARGGRRRPPWGRSSPPLEIFFNLSRHLWVAGQSAPPPPQIPLAGQID
jgi:hypothetical protein